MITANELRLGNYLLQKINTRISPVPCGYMHFELLAKAQGKDLFPMVLKPEILEKCGFKENKDYALLPQAREFRLVLPVHGSQANEIYAYVKSNGECFGRATASGLPVSNNFFYLHALQNLYFALTGKELQVSL